MGFGQFRDDFCVKARLLVKRLAGIKREGDP